MKFEEREKAKEKGKDEFDDSRRWREAVMRRRWLCRGGKTSQTLRALSKSHRTKSKNSSIRNSLSDLQMKIETNWA